MELMVNLSWDDFRLVKAVADHRSLAESAKALGINQSTVFRKLSQVERRAGARLFKRGRANYTLTPQGERMAALAARMEREVAAFEQHLNGTASSENLLVTGVIPREEVMARSGLEFLTDMVNGKLPQAPMCATLGFHLAKVSEGYARFDGTPE